MSATVILETFDAQMTDYSGDMDVSMQPVGQIIDSWAHTEATMEDDGVEHHHYGDPQDFAEPRNVEVEMEAYEENPEYEMADSADPHHLGEGELLDVEVYDASRAHSPAAINTLLVDASPAPSAEAAVAIPGVVTVDPGSAEQPYEDTPVIVVHEGNFINQSESAEPGVHGISDENTTLPAAEAPIVEAIPADSVLPEEHVNVHEDDSNVPSLENLTVDRQEQLVKGIAGVEEDDIAAQHQDSRDNVLHVVEEDHDDSHTSRAQADNTGEVPNDGNHVEDASSDPHEISEGVYIDPPPGVLLTVSTHEGPGYSLFNQPDYAMLSGGSKDEETPLVVLLAHRPTLYYEPLNNVFDALRQEEHIGALHDITRGELVLDAYDLQLIMHEDNRYSHEVTLHDLNMIHDSSGFSGPLRLNLSLTTPRFIVRYHTLREQMNRLHIAGEAEESHIEHGHSEDQHGEETARAHNPLPSDDARPEEQGHEELQGDTEVADDPDDPEPESEVTQAGVEEEGVEEEIENDPGAEELALPIVNNEESEYHDVSGEGATALEGENDYSEQISGADAVTAKEPEDTLDTDAVHDTEVVAGSVIPDEGRTEYEEYGLEAEEEDDERYGDALPEELGGSNGLGFVSEDVGVSESAVPVNDLQEPFSESASHDASLLDVDGSSLVTSPNADIANSPVVGNATNEESDILYVQESQELQEESTVSLKSLSSSAASTTNLSRDVDETTEHGRLSEQLTAEDSAQPLEIPDGPDALDDEQWDDSLDGEGEIDYSWLEDPEAVSNESSTTMSTLSKSSKRGRDEVELDPDEEDWSSPDSPNSKRARVS